MKFKIYLLIIIFSAVPLVSVPAITSQSKGSVSTNEVYFPYFKYRTNNTIVNGVPNEKGYFNFNVTTPSGSMIWVFWRNNGADADVILQSNETGFIAIAWRNVKPITPTVNELLNGSNVIIGSEGQARDATGYFNGSQKVDANLLDNIINSSVTTDEQGIRMQFTYPLDDKCPLDPTLDVGTYSYMVFATGPTKSIDAEFNANTTAFYVPDVYVGTWMDSSYVPPPSNSLPFSDITLILLALIGLPFLQKMRKK